MLTHVNVFRELFRNRCFLHDLEVTFVVGGVDDWKSASDYRFGNLSEYIWRMYANLPRLMMMLCVCVRVCSTVRFFSELCNWVVHFGSQTTTKEWTPCRLGQSECLLNRHQVGTEQKRYGFVSLNFGQKVTWPGGAWVGSGSNKHNPSAVVSYFTCSKFLPTNEHIENNTFQDVLGVTHYRGFHKEDFHRFPKLCPNDQGSDFAQGFGHEVSCRKRDCGRGAFSKFNGDDRIDVYFATFKQCMFHRKACKTIDPCLWFRRILGWILVFDKELGCTNKTQVVEIFVWPDRLICPNSLVCWCVHDSIQ